MIYFNSTMYEQLANLASPFLVVGSVTAGSSEVFRSMVREWMLSCPALRKSWRNDPELHLPSQREQS